VSQITGRRDRGCTAHLRRRSLVTVPNREFQQRMSRSVSLAAFPCLIYAFLIKATDAPKWKVPHRPRQQPRVGPFSLGSSRIRADRNRHISVIEQLALENMKYVVCFVVLTAIAAPIARS